MEAQEFFELINRNTQYLPVNTTNVLNSILGFEEGDIATPISQFFEMTLPNTLKLAKIGSTPIFKFRFAEKKIWYNYSDLDEALKANLTYKSNNHTMIVTHIKTMLEAYLRTQEQTFDGFFRSDFTSATDNYPVLERFAGIINENNEPDSFTFMLRYPFINIGQGLRKHLLLGFASNTGKSVITAALNNLYEESSIIKEIRAKSVFDEGNWNADVIDKFLTIIDDDGGDDFRDGKVIDENFIKNFMNPQMPLRLARSGHREGRVYHGSSVIATNTDMDVFHDKQNDKRIIYFELATDIRAKFSRDELNYLHNIPRGDLLNYVFNHPLEHDEYYWYFDRVNRYPTNYELEEQKVALINFVAANQRVKLSELVREGFDKQFIRTVLGKPTTIKRAGTAIYGYKDEATSQLNLLEQVSETVEYYRYPSVTNASNQLLVNQTLSEFALDIMGNYDKGREKKTYPTFGPYALKTNKSRPILTEITKSTALVIDVDDSKYHNLDQVYFKMQKTGYKGLLYETPSSNAEDLRYRVVIPGLEYEDNRSYKRAVQRLGKYLQEDIDTGSATIAHRYIMAGTNVQIFGQAVLDPDALVAFIQNTEKGQGKRHMRLFWALNRAHDDNDIELAKRICEASTLPESEIRATLTQIWEKEN